MRPANIFIPLCLFVACISISPKKPKTEKSTAMAAAAATVASSLPSIPATRSRNSSFFSPTSVATTSSTSSACRKVRLRMPCRAMVQQAAQGAPAAYAKEMERLSAKESLLLAFKDAGGFEALVSGKLTEVQQIDVNERITGLERLNPTPRPTT
ncbi:unnamed protein product [Linum tenue]|nr:unnamed protein product [Linum tenue]